MSRETVAAAIAESPLFSRCTQAEAMHVAQAMVRLEVADGAVLVKEGDARVGEMNAMYVIVEGSVDLGAVLRETYKAELDYENGEPVRWENGDPVVGKFVETICVTLALNVACREVSFV